MKSFFSSNTEELFVYITDLIEDSINSILKSKDYVVIAFPGGRSAKKIYENLRNKKIDWSRVHIFLIDERKVSLDSEESNFKILNDELLKNIKIPSENVHPYNYDEETANYTEELFQLGGLDITVLSAGEDGHIASLFPEHPSIFNEEEGFIDVDDSPKLPKERISASASLILESDLCILLFIGEDKRKALKTFLRGRESTEEFPATLVHSISNSYLFTDQK
ncbi:6-phosphogluconolactonase [Candidatus Woesearchaeota archaeon]|nr:6-phosphogluconolactonase [Candidatus Woesearchaeota archaeon]